MGENRGNVLSGDTRLNTHTSIDPRAAKTRGLIFGAIVMLTSDTKSSLTVADIVRTAGISRSTFYAHFAGLDELAIDYLQQAFVDIGSAGTVSREHGDVTAFGAARVGYARLVTHLLEHHAFYMGVLDLPLMRLAYDEAVTEYARQLVETMVEFSTPPPSVRTELVASYVAGGALTLISSWMRGQFDLSDDELVEQMVGLLPPWLRETDELFSNDHLSPHNTKTNEEGS